MTWRSQVTKNPHSLQAGIGKASGNGGRRILYGQQAGVSKKVPVNGAARAPLITEHRYHKLFENIRDGVLLLNANTAQIEDVNPSLISMLGYSYTELLGKKLPEVGFFEDKAWSRKLLTNIKDKGYVRYEDISLITKSGSQIDVELVCDVYECEGIKIIQCNIRDISEHQIAQLKARRDAQLFAALSECNKAIVQSTNENDLFLKVCCAAVEHGNMEMAWVGLVDNKTLIVKPVACFGKNVEYLKKTEISADPDKPSGRGPVGSAINEQQPHWSQDFQNDPTAAPWHALAAQFNWGAAAALPLYRENVVAGVLVLYSQEVNAFDEAARSLLVEMAMDVSYALDNLEREAKRKQVEQKLSRNALRHQALMKTSFDGIHVMDDKGNVLEANNAFCKMLGYTQKEIMRLNVADWDMQWSAEELQVAFKDFVGKSGLIETVHRCKDGSLINVEISVSGVNLDGHNYFFGASRDITERKRTEKELLIAATAFEAQEGIVVTDSDNVILRVNKSFTRLTGYTAEDAIGQTPRLLHSGMQDADFYKQMWQDLTRNQSWHGEVWNRRKNGEIYPEWLNISAVLNSEGQVTNYIGSFIDITERKAAEERVEHLAFYDHLTDMPNRRLFLDRLQHTQAASVRHNHYSAVLFIDLDNFKVLNDTRGHSVGDLFLMEVANRLDMLVRTGDTVARLGGDEFIILLEKLSEARLQAASQAEIVCEKILAAFNQPFLLNEYEYHSSASIGICLFRGYEASVDELLKRADTAMYQAKNEGRNTMRFYDPAMQADLQARTSLVDDLRIALKKNQFRLYYQMQVDHTGVIVGAETLIRWQHPERGLLPPVEFISLAEDTGLITLIGQWVLDTACAQLKNWGSDPRMCNLRLAVNVSARQFHQEDFVDQISQTINSHAIKPGMLKLELTESLVLDNIEETILKMHALKKAGVIFSMDDFGTGYSSLSNLTKLPLDQLKIDQDFVRHMDVNNSDSVIVQTIIGMAHNLGMEVIAEGVETEIQRDSLKQMGCLFYQGYLYSKPLPLDEFEVMLEKYNLHNLH